MWGLGPSRSVFTAKWTQRKEPQVNDDVTALFGLPGFQVLSGENVDGEWHLGVETPRDLVGCGECGAVAEVKDRREVTVRDLPTAAVPVLTRWRKRVFHCPHALCPNKSWTEQHAAIAPRAVLTDRARQWAFEQVARRDPVGRRGRRSAGRRLAHDHEAGHRARETDAGRPGPAR